MSDGDPGLGVFVAMGAVAAASVVALFVGHRDATTVEVDEEAPARPSPSASMSPVPPQSRDQASRTVVRVIDHGEPSAGRLVVFQAWDGAILATERTDEKGEAASDLVTGDMVTVEAAPGAARSELTTVTHLVPGEQVLVGSDDARREVARARVKIPGVLLGRDAGKMTHVVDVGGGRVDVPDPNARTVVPIRAGYVSRDGTFKVIAEALAPNGESVAFSVGEGKVAEADAASEPSVDVDLHTWSVAWDAVELSLRSVPAGARSAEIGLDLVWGGATFALPSHHAELDPAREERARFEKPRGLTESGRMKFEVAFDDDPHGERSRLVGAVALRLPDLGISVIDDMLPRVGDVALEPGADKARPIVTWRAPEDTKRIDTTIVRLAWQSEGARSWTIVMPADVQGRVPLPALPDELAASRPGAAPVRAAVAVIDASAYAGYRDVKKRGAESLLDGSLPRKVGFVRMSLAGEL